MASAVRPRPTHYDMLGLSPSATQEEIGRAFARAMGMFGAHSAASAAQVSAAFGILRDPAKRRDYDRAIGLVRDPLPRQWGFSATAPAVPGLLGSAWRGMAEQVTGEPVLPPQEQESEPQAEPRLASFIASSTRNPRAPVLERAPAPEPAATPDREEESVAQVQREIEHILAPRRHEAAIEPESDEQAFDWRRPVLVAAGLLASAGIIGAFAGMSVKDNVQAQSNADGVTVGLPAAKANKAPSALDASVQPAYQAPVEAPVRRAAKPSVRERAARQPQAAFAEEAVQQSASAQTALDGTDQAVAADATSAPTPTPAALPLPKSVVARTIERIGYSCGSVVSTSAVDGGAPGTFSVTCSSGQTYQASPVHGRYRFRRSSH